MVTELMCKMCVKPVVTGKEIVEKIGDEDCVFDKDECVTMFKKLNDVYGDYFCIGFAA